MTEAFIVDDREVDRFTARRRLAKSGHFSAVHEAEDGAAFLDKLFGGAPQGVGSGPLVLMDIAMPVMDGFETVDALRARMIEKGWPEDVTVVMVTSSGAEIDRARAAQRPLVRGYFEKPIRKDDVDAMMALLPHGPS